MMPPVGDIIRSLLRLARQNQAAPFIIEHGGTGKVTVWTSATALRKQLGDFPWLAKVLKDVDFTTEQVVLVSWTTSGPPEGELRSRSSTVRGKNVIDFYVDPPKGARVRGERARLGAYFFAIPRDATAIYTPEP
jgi:hypothetical protein